MSQKDKSGQYFYNMYKKQLEEGTFVFSFDQVQHLVDYIEFLLEEREDKS